MWNPIEGTWAWTWADVRLIAGEAAGVSGDAGVVKAWLHALVGGEDHWKIRFAGVAEHPFSDVRGGVGGTAPAGASGPGRALSRSRLRWSRPKVCSRYVLGPLSHIWQIAHQTAHSEGAREVGGAGVSTVGEGGTGGGGEGPEVGLVVVSLAGPGVSLGVTCSKALP